MTNYYSLLTPILALESVPWPCVYIKAAMMIYPGFPLIMEPNPGLHHATLGSL